MAGANDAGFVVGQQDGGAVGRQDAQHHARPVRYEPVGLGRSRGGPAIVADGQNVGRVNLMQGLQVGFIESEMSGHATAVFAHVLRLVARAVAAIQRGIEATADAALAREEAVLHPIEVGKRLGESCRVRAKGR